MMNNPNLIKSFSYSKNKNYKSYILKLESSKFKITEKRDDDYNLIYDIERIHSYNDNIYHFSRCDKDFSCFIYYKGRRKEKVKAKDFIDICKKLENQDKKIVFY